MFELFDEEALIERLMKLDAGTSRTSHLLFEEDYWDDDETDFDEEALNEMLTEMESGTSTTKLIYDEYEDDIYYWDDDKIPF